MFQKHKFVRCQRRGEWQVGLAPTPPALSRGLCSKLMLIRLHLASLPRIRQTGGRSRNCMLNSKARQ